PNCNLDYEIQQFGLTIPQTTRAALPPRPCRRVDRRRRDNPEYHRYRTVLGTCTESAPDCIDVRGAAAPEIGEQPGQIRCGQLCRSQRGQVQKRQGALRLYAATAVYSTSGPVKGFLRA